jgi:hypothetical protein
MSFLNPVILPLLLLASLPIIIHLLNRLRYRSVKWAAIMFLIAANRSSTKHARLRHYLILGCRCLLLLFFLLALARPMIGGWLGGHFAGAPDTVLILLDRSASMESTDPRLQMSKRARAIQLFREAEGLMRGKTRYVLVENVLREPREISGPGELEDYLMASATDTAADIPVMLNAAAEYIVNNPEGRTEIWMASDMQASNWLPTSKEWQRVSSLLASLPQDVRVRLIMLGDDVQANATLAVRDVERMHTGDAARLRLSADLNRTSRMKGSFPLVMNLNGARSQIDMTMPGNDFRFNRILDLGEESGGGGWGVIELPADENNRDNTGYFVFGGQHKIHTVLLGPDTAALRFYGLASVPDGETRVTQTLTPEGINELDWESLSLLVWQAGDLPDTAKQLEPFVQSGGVLLCIPPGVEAVGPLGLTWQAPELATSDQPFRVTSWEERSGPLARTGNGDNLPLAELDVIQRQLPAGLDADATNNTWIALAEYADGAPFLLRRAMGDGWVYLCTSLPGTDWSTLDTGLVLVPMMQRLLRLGGLRNTRVRMEVSGDWHPKEQLDEPWVAVDGDESKDARWDAGIYASGNRLVALNRPLAEDDLHRVEAETIPALFGEVEVKLVENLGTREATRLSSEIWRSFVLFALLFMVLESMLLLMENSSRKADHGFNKTPTDGAVA